MSNVVNNFSFGGFGDVISSMFCKRQLGYFLFLDLGRSRF